MSPNRSTALAKCYPVACACCAACHAMLCHSRRSLWYCTVSTLLPTDCTVSVPSTISSHLSHHTPKGSYHTYLSFSLPLIRALFSLSRVHPKSTNNSRRPHSCACGVVLFSGQYQEVFESRAYQSPSPSLRLRVTAWLDCRSRLSASPLQPGDQYISLSLVL